jgi:transcription elongation factor GreB
MSSIIDSDLLLTVRPLGTSLGAEVRGIDFSKPLTTVTLEQIQLAWTKYLVLRFRGMPTLSADDLIVDADRKLTSWSILDRRQQPGGYAALRSELIKLMNEERPAMVQIVSWAASNGDRSENGDYLYGKKRLREIDRRMRFLTKRLELAEIVDPAEQQNRDQVFFGATVLYADQTGLERRVTIVGVDEAEPLNGKISWISPVARALNKARVGDTITLLTPGGIDELDILEVSYAIA